MRSHTVALLSAALLAAACSSSSTPSTGSGAPPAPSESAVADGGDDTAHDPSPTEPIGDSGPPGDGAASEPPEDLRLYPLDVGRRWTWNIASVGAGYAICPPGTRDAEVLEKTTTAGKNAYLIRGYCTGVPASYVAEESAGIVGLYQGAWATFLKLPPAEGEAWSYFNASYHWEKAGTVTVAAGTFDDCWTTVQNVTYLNETTYCPGIGAVRVRFADLAGNGWNGEVTAMAGP